MAPSSGGPGSQPRQQHENRSGSNPIGENSRSTQQWKDVPRGTMDEVSPLGRLDLPTATQGRPLDCSTSSSDPMMEGPWCRFRREARARERHRHCKDESLKVLDPKRPIREADIHRCDYDVRFVPTADVSKCSKNHSAQILHRQLRAISEALAPKTLSARPLRS